MQLKYISKKNLLLKIYTGLLSKSMLDPSQNLGLGNTAQKKPVYVKLNAANGLPFTSKNNPNKIVLTPLNAASPGN